MPGASYTPRLFMPTKRFSTMSMRPMPLRPPISFSWFDNRERAELLPVDADRHAPFKTDRHLLHLVGRLLRGNGHAEIDRLHAVDGQFLQLSGFIADVQAIFVRTVWLGDGSLDRDVLLLADTQSSRTGLETVCETLRFATER